MQPAGAFVFDERFVEAFYSRLPGTKRHRVFGRELRPFCLWHQLQLEMLDSPFLLGGVVRALDVDKATRVCMTRFRERVILPKCSMWNRMTWALNLRGDTASEAKKFEHYLLDYYAPPQYWPKDEATPDPQIDQSLQMVLTIAKATGWPQEYIWEMPVGEAHWIMAGLAVLDGAECLIWTPMDQEARERHLARKAAVKKARYEELIKQGKSPEEAMKQAGAEEQTRTEEAKLTIAFVKKGLGPEAASAKAKEIMAARSATGATPAAVAAGDTPVG